MVLGILVNYIATTEFPMKAVSFFSQYVFTPDKITESFKEHTQLNYGRLYVPLVQPG